jgi:diguanylate cyclase (GGDEF)-like protein
MSWEDEHTKASPPSGVINPSTARDQIFLVALAGANMGEMIKITAPRTVIGRGQTADIRIFEESISREHCEILLQDGKAILRDLGSMNGTYCRGARIDRHELAEGDKILVGSGKVYKFTYNDKIDESFQRQMYESALRDDLTKLYNRKYFGDRVESEFAYSMRHNAPLTLVFIDVDLFKKINDTYGHPAGDRVLSGMASMLLGAVRVEDVCARLGGEEFAVICRGTSLMQGQVVGERLREVVQAHKFPWEDKQLAVTISIGLATIPTPSIREAVQLVAAADTALYEAKQSGRNRVCVWQESSRGQAGARPTKANV